MNKIHYSSDVDALLIELNNNPIAYAEEEGKTILHYSEDDQLVLIEKTGEKTAVVIDLKEWGQLWNEFYQNLLDRSPVNEDWINRSPFREKLDQALTWNANHPPQLSDLESLKSKLDNH